MRKLTNIEVVNRICGKNPCLTLLSPYRGRNKRMMVKDADGIIYNVLADKLFVGKTPSLATAIDKSLGFSIKARKKHGNRYGYDKVDYIASNIKVIITCPIHGDFSMSPSNHLIGQGCPECGVERARPKYAKNGFSRTQWIEYCNDNNKQAKLYVIECFNDKERFVKIGITTRKIKARFWKTNMPYKYNVISILEDKPEVVYDKEKSLHRKFKKYKYVPILDFDGYRECFESVILNEL